LTHNSLRLAILAGLTAAISLPATAATSDWKIDPAHSSAQFAVRHLGISTVRGAFTKVTGTVRSDDQDVTKSSVEVTIDTDSVDTRVPDRDKDLRSERFFDVAKYPTIAFKSKKVEQAGAGKLKVTGDLTIHGTTREVILDVDGPTPAIKDPWGNQRAAANATTKINRQEFGMKFNDKMPTGDLLVGDDITITIDVEMIRPGAVK
jgi:polyisoprenoid-binding protein YceI